MVRRKNISDWVWGVPVRISNFSANGASNNITSVISTALGTAGRGGLAVPLQASVAEGLGVVTNGSTSRAYVYSAIGQDAFTTGDGEIVYGRVTESSGVYTLSYYTLTDAGQETAYSFSSSTAIDFDFNYRFDAARVPTDAIIRVFLKTVGEGSSAYPLPVTELLTVTATNTLSSLSKTPISAANFQLIVENCVYDTFGGSNASVSVNLSTKAVSWNPSSPYSNFNIETTDRVIARYFSVE